MAGTRSEITYLFGLSYVVVLSSVWPEECWHGILHYKSKTYPLVWPCSQFSAMLHRNGHGGHVKNVFAVCKLKKMGKSQFQE